MDLEAVTAAGYSRECEPTGSLDALLDLVMDPTVPMAVQEVMEATGVLSALAVTEAMALAAMVVTVA
ncbi:MAG: hypothetical protein GXP28_02655 [Planctomycetes bacterium]|nr:hypothetical protein [Planctomycetota bacterium]